MVDPTTLILVVSSAAAGIFGGRRTASNQAASTWRDLYDAERQRSSDKGQQNADQAKQIAELTADLASLRARPDMTRLATITTDGFAQMSAEHKAILAALERISR